MSVVMPEEGIQGAITDERLERITKQMEVLVLTATHAMNVVAQAAVAFQQTTELANGLLNRLNVAVDENIE